MNQFEYSSSKHSNQMKKSYIILAICLMIGISAQAQSKTVNIEKAGTLSELLTDDDKNTTENMIVTGQINNTDIAVLAAMSREKRLRTIDLSSASWTKEAPANPVLDDPNEYFLPMIAILGKPMDPDGFAYEEQTMGHTRDPRSMAGFWIFQTGKTLFPLTGYMNGWDGNIDEAVLKSNNADWIRSSQVRTWIEGMGYQFSSTRDDGDDIFYNSATKVWVLLHYTPYNTQDYPGVHFSLSTYEY